MRVSAVGRCVAASLLLTTTSAFVAIQPQAARQVTSVRRFASDDDNAVEATEESSANLMMNPVQVAATTALMTAMTATPANAAGPDWGIFEGRTGSLLHPVIMGGMFLYSLYTAFMGFQWRRQRTIGEDIKELQKGLPEGIKTPEDILVAQQQEGADTIMLRDALPVAQQVAELQQERKDLVALSPRDKHFAQGALLAFLGTAFAIEGPLNTYARAGKLFPGPHLYVGAGLVVLWALAVATIPPMQKGSETARSIHIGANCLGLAFFAWQVQSGLPILFKVIEKTSWP